MSSTFSEKMEQEYYDELFMQNAAKLVDSELLDELDASQKQTIDAQWLNSITQQSIQSVKRKQKRLRTYSAILRLGRTAAILVLTVAVLFGSVYLTVDAARESINNFFLGNRNERSAIIRPGQPNSGDSDLIPTDWSCPISPSWVPKGYSLSSSGEQLNRYWWLVYCQENTENTICIYIWDNSYAPSIDMEEYEVINKSLIQSTPATVYLDSKNNFYTLVMVKDNYTVQITGAINGGGIVEIAEKISF